MLPYDQLPSYKVQIDMHRTAGEIQPWRACIGQGGINSLPLTGEVIAATRALRLPLIRIFLQQYLDVLKPDGSYDWGKMDAYVQSFAQTGAAVMAALCLKPPVLFPKIDERILFADDLASWENLAEAVARRYAGVVTHWEVGNETDIGEWGGCPYLVEDNDQYNQYYRITAAALLRGNPEAKIGGSAAAMALSGSQLPALIEFCRSGHAPLHFISWHVYHDDPEVHVASIRRYRELLENWPYKKPETCVTEWSASFPSETGSVAETADDPMRTASLFSSVCRFMEEGLDYSFYYHLCDNTFYHDEFRPFYEKLDIMDKHWNQVPHRFGMFGLDGRARPHYQLWRMMRSLTGRQLIIEPTYPDLRSLAGADDNTVQVMAANFNTHRAQPLVADLWFRHLPPGVYRVLVERIHGRENLSRDGLRLDPIDVRDISTTGVWRYPLFLPPHAVARVVLEKVPAQ